ncbi:NAD-dependent protein deacylase Sirt4-like isoform X2 [Neocloeon triangulifer]|nr:NAD-dependent protein deacylase Sirt4-like isoform X2 [Neocloeon triangulifer]XP_059474223.1 NAD-dependent protein deacylase Sirt4-like isoform X2 [Neocloeon triangulifer]XP_059474224.1 NAD-dependent protein deacylase Sirt4-like isoform X2 [Neocloeon triangulifer]XP_059474225.1 NAD-dependent protein deacylase Sirt4-like isoform X2 [Neocloeon triangulifer]
MTCLYRRMILSRSRVASASAPITEVLSVNHPRGFATSINYVPQHKPVRSEDVEPLIEFVQSSKNLFVITGAGVSTESGLPDYRSEGTGLVARRPNFKPTNYQDFMKKESTRRIYWARSFTAWNYQTQRKPNITHYTLANWEDRGKIGCLVTQNVDRLHQKAGSKKIIELHGTLFEVRCMGCENIIDRCHFQEILTKANKSLINLDFEAAALRPDGDIELSKEVSQNFQVPACEKCGSGILKPDVVFYGENLPLGKKDEVRQELEKCDSLLVLGSTLHTRSGRDHVEYAFKKGIPIGLINIGPSFGDNVATFKINSKCGEVMSIVAQELL